MRIREVLADGFGRIGEAVHDCLDGLSVAQLAFRVDPEANTIAWLVWHLTRIQDDHVADVAGRPQAWIADGWFDRFGLALPARDHGYGHSPEQVAAVRVESADLLTGYYDAVQQVTLGFVAGIEDADLDRVVDTRWDPPVTLGVRLVSVIADDLQHVGQAMFVRGVLQRTS